MSFQILELLVGPAVVAALVSTAWDWHKRNAISKAEVTLQRLRLEGEAWLAAFRQQLDSEAQKEAELRAAARERDLAELKAATDLRVIQAKQEIEANAARSSAREHAILDLLRKLRAAVKAARRLTSSSAIDSDDVLLSGTADALPRLAAFVEAAELGGALIYLDDDERTLCVECRRGLLRLFLALDFDLISSTDPDKAAAYQERLRAHRRSLDDSYEQLVSLVRTKRANTRPVNTVRAGQSVSSATSAQ